MQALARRTDRVQTRPVLAPSTGFAGGQHGPKGQSGIAASGCRRGRQALAGSARTTAAAWV